MMAGLNYGSGLASGVQGFFQGRELADKENHQATEDARQARRDQILEQQFQTNQQINGLTLRKDQADVQRQAAQELYNGILAGDVKGGIQRHNQLDPGNPITAVSPDPNDKTGDTWIVQDSSGATPYSLKQVGKLFHPDPRGKDRYMSLGNGSALDVTTGGTVGHEPADKPKDRYITVGDRLFDTSTRQFVDGGPGAGGIQTPKDADKVRTSDGQWKTEGELRKTFGQIYGTWDPIMQQYSINKDAPPYLQWRNRTVSPEFKWPETGTPSGQYPWQSGGPRDGTGQPPAAGGLSPLSGGQPQVDSPPVPGARRAPDGNWYVQQGQGWARVDMGSQGSPEPASAPPSSAYLGNIGKLRTSAEMAADQAASSPTAQRAKVESDIQATKGERQQSAAAMASKFGLTSTTNRGKEYTRLAKAFTDVSNQVKKGQLPSYDDLYAALQFASGRNDQESARQIADIINQYYKQ